MLVLCISFLALSVSVLYSAERLYILWIILIGCSVGGLIGYRMKYKGDMNTFLRILFLAMLSLSLSFLLYVIIKDSSLIYILLLNGSAITYSIILLRRQKRNSSELSEN